MKIIVILGSTRPGRVTERVAKWVVAAAKENSEFGEVELLDLLDYDLPHFNEPISPRYNPKRQPTADVKRFLDKLESADGYVIVTPEYNHGIPGVLKDALDYADWQLVKKPVAIVGHGSVGAARAIEQLKLIVSFSGAAIVPDTVGLMGGHQALSEQGEFIGDVSNPYGAHQQIHTVLGELAWWTATLKAGRK